MNKKLHTIKYVLLDYLSALTAWCIFFIYRRLELDQVEIQSYTTIINDPHFIIGIVFIPFCWLILYTFVGSYKKIYRKSRINELGQTLLSTTIGVLVIFFIIILDDVIINYTMYYKSVVALWIIHFTLTYIPRLILTSHTLRKIRNQKIGFATIIVGSNGNALNIYNELKDDFRACSNKFIGFVNAIECDDYPLTKYIPHLGSYKDLKNIIQKHHIEEVIIAIERSETNSVDRIIREIAQTDTYIKVIPEMSDILMGAVRTTSIWSPFIELQQDSIPIWQSFLKRSMDIVVSLFALVFLSPIYVLTAIGVKRSSPGPVIYKQQRIGKYGKPFMMYKFRSMYVDAEKNGEPKLSSKNDDRITKFGLFMRKIRLDEIPQFFSVLKGDMSLVGPRPERQFFIDKIVEKAPEYYLLQSIKPGITSWGQVKFGYAENVEEMIKRMKYDLLYLENRSLVTDLKILIYTVIIVLQGRGK